eukprot:gb/GECH01000992.1/.p1 GENE.gb/GECH01000992.1/~~gb/GECH01000992.1/.p1  ORF type:complete len:299 (+),score=61.70 gb/GECH01000992.1/:1-897(+)
MNSISKNSISQIITREQLKTEYNQLKYIKLLDQYQQGNYAACFTTCLALISKVPYSRQIWFVWAECCRQLGLIIQAKRCYIYGLQLRPLELDAVLRFQTFVDHFAFSQYKDHIKAYVLQLNPNRFETVLKSLPPTDHVVAFRLLSDYFLRFPDASPQIYRKAAHELEQRSMLRYAVVVLRAGLKIHRFDRELWRDLCAIYRKLDKPLNAFKALIHAAALRPGGPSRHDYDLCGRLLESGGHPWHALQCYRHGARDVAHLQHVQKDLVPRLMTDRYLSSILESYRDVLETNLPSLREEE